MNNRKPVVIMGGGLAGLTAANYLHKHNVPVRVFEAGKQLAGLARTESDADGFTYDFGAHFITNRLAAAVGVSATSRPMPRYGETVWLNGKSYSYPFGLMKSVKYVLSAATAKVRGLFQERPKSAAEWYQRSYGHKLANEVAIPLTEAWSGSPAHELAPSVGDKFANSVPRLMMLKAAARITRRTVAIGYSGTFPESPHVWHVYPDGGIGAVCERLADPVRNIIQTESPVEAIYVENNRVVGVRAAGHDVEASAVISTAPVYVLPKLLRGTDRLNHLAQFRYRPMLFVNLRINGPTGLPDVVTWTPSKQFPFFRLSDIGAGSPWLVPDGKSQITADIGCQIGDEVWKATDEDLGNRCITALDTMLPGIKSRYLGCRVMRTPVAYPVYRTEYEPQRKRFEQDTDIDGLISIGRNGEFSHALMEDIFWRTRRKLIGLITANR